jgi:glycolate oxidase
VTAEPTTNHEIVLTARENLSDEVWNYVSGGAESETTMRRNRLGFDSLALRPRICVDVAEIDASTRFLGHRLRIPVMMAPIGSLQMITPGGGVAVADAAARFGTMPFISSVTQPGLEEIAASTDSPKILQLYIRGDDDWLEDILLRVKQAGYTSLCLTVDTAAYGRRERQSLNRWAPPTRQAAESGDQARLTWEMAARIKETVGLPVMLKGVATAEDARIAVDHGFEVIYVSNHGGRQLDHCLGSIQMLPEIVEAVGGRAAVVLDGGVMRGTDVLKALALGCDAVTIGKLQGWGLAAGGADGLVRVLEILEEELLTAMALLGVTRLDELSREHVCTAPVVAVPGEISAFPHLPSHIPSFLPAI